MFRIRIMIRGQKMILTCVYKLSNIHLISRFCKAELDFKFLQGIITSVQINWNTYYQVSAIEPLTIYVHKPTSKVLVVRECLKEFHIENMTEHVFISGDNPHFTNRFYRVVLVPFTISMMISESPSRSIGSPAIRFQLSGHPSFMSANQIQQ